MSKPRIIAGTAKGQFLDTPTKGTRPSPARLREALFSMLEFEQRGTFLDLFSGSGAIGLEASSRGWHSTCVDLSSGAVKVLKANNKKLKLDAKIIKADALKFIKTEQKYDIVFAAPPYPLDLVSIFQQILESNIASPEGFYIFQYPTKLAIPLATKPYKTKKYGFNSLSFYRK
ncbi:MAG TPA: methyltransferase domain-containing protein [Trueperaceae bacterium]|nr:methyltransferase domain-containing protein [Trueperaceae bacterium]